jgi:hypothetical protein
MRPKGRLEWPAPSPRDVRSRRKKQTSDEELDEVRKRGRYVVLPHVEYTPQNDWMDLIL